MRLEREMKKFSGNIRSVVKAHGLQQRSNVVGQTFAVFRVDRIHHLLSVVSKVKQHLKIITKSNDQNFVQKQHPKNNVQKQRENQLS